MGSRDVQRSDETDAARWIIERLSADSHRVDMLLPGGFDAYIRLLHAVVVDSESGRQLIRWAELAGQTGTTKLDRRVQFTTLAGRLPAEPPTVPVQGELPAEQLDVLAGLLGVHTSTPERCWFCIWEGYGPVTGRPALVQAALGRRYLLHTGPLQRVTTLDLPPGLWWPDDHAWCVATDVDLDSTYLGGSAALAQALLNCPALETLPARLSDSITQDADQAS